VSRQIDSIQKLFKLSAYYVLFQFVHNFIVQLFLDVGIPSEHEDAVGQWCGRGVETSKQKQSWL